MHRETIKKKIHVTCLIAIVVLWWRSGSHLLVSPRHAQVGHQHFCLDDRALHGRPSLPLELIPLFCLSSVWFSSVQSLSRVWFFVTSQTAAHQASQSITNFQSLLKLMSIESVMPSNHLILCRPLLLLPPIPPSIRVFSNESTLRMRWPKYWSFNFSISPSSEYSGLSSCAWFAPNTPTSLSSFFNSSRTRQLPPEVSAAALPCSHCPHLLSF